jgi:hypothetical protein
MLPARCKNVFVVDASKQECHFHRQDVYESGADDWCDNGMWLYQEKDDEVIIVFIILFLPINSITLL